MRARQACESRYRLLFDAAGDAVLFLQLTEDGRPDHYLEVNEAASRQYGYTRKELTTMPAADLTAAELRPRIPELVKNLVERRYLRFEWKHVTKDGRLIPVEITSRLFEFGGPYPFPKFNHPSRHAVIASEIGKLIWCPLFPAGRLIARGEIGIVSPDRRWLSRPATSRSSSSPPAPSAT